MMGHRATAHLSGFQYQHQAAAHSVEQEQHQQPLALPRQPPTIDAAQLTPELFARYRGKRPLLVKNFVSTADLAPWQPPPPPPRAPGQEEVPLNALQADILPAGAQIEAMVARDDRHFVDHSDFTEYVNIPAEVMMEQVTRTCPGAASSHPAQVTAASRRYYHRCVVPPSLLPTLRIRERVEQNCFRDPQDRVRAELVKAWLSSPGCVTPLHYDRCHGFLVQVVGTKYFMQINAADAPHLYPSKGGPGRGGSHISRVPDAAQLYGVDIATGQAHTRYAAFHGASAAINASGMSSIEDPNAAHVLTPDVHGVSQQLSARAAWTLRTFPRVREADPPFGVLLQPGDALYTPPGWFHEVLSVSGSISVTIPWDMSSRELEGNEMPVHMAL